MMLTWTVCIAVVTYMFVSFFGFFSPLVVSPPCQHTDQVRKRQTDYRFVSLILPSLFCFQNQNHVCDRQVPFPVHVSFPGTTCNKFYASENRPWILPVMLEEKSPFGNGSINHNHSVCAASVWWKESFNGVKESPERFSRGSLEENNRLWMAG